LVASEKLLFLIPFSGAMALRAKSSSWRPDVKQKKSLTYCF
jgi:hypothetical protein